MLRYQFTAFEDLKNQVCGTVNGETRFLLFESRLFSNIFIVSLFIDLIYRFTFRCREYHYFDRYCSGTVFGRLQQLRGGSKFQIMVSINAINSEIIQCYNRSR